MADTVILGAGIAGLLAATQLQKSGQDVLVLDKGHQVGGRMATRALAADGSAQADHGAQFFTVRAPKFQAWVDEWLAQGVAAEWCRGFSGQDGYPRYRGVPSMTAIPKKLAAGLDVRSRVEVTKITQENGHWQLETKDGNRFSAKRLLLTAPVPQSLALLDAGGLQLETAVRQALESIEYTPCFAAMVLLNGPSQIRYPGGVQEQGAVISWIGDNGQKGVSSRPTVTIHASAEFSQMHLEEEPQKVGRLLISAAHEAGYLNKSSVADVQVKRWMYAQPSNCYADRFLRAEIAGLPVVFAGDGFKHARVEGAALSGLAAAESLLNET